MRRTGRTPIESNDVGHKIYSFSTVYALVKRGYSNQELIEKRDELSLIMLINKLRNSSEFKELRQIPPSYFEYLEENTPEYLLKLISKIIAVLLYRLNVPREEVEEFADQIERREFDMLFDSFEAYDVQETRRKSKAEGKAEGKAESILELLSDLGMVSEKVKKIIMRTTDPQQLSIWLKLAAKAESVEQFCSRAGL